jgi:hypothetical protein
MVFLGLGLGSGLGLLFAYLNESNDGSYPKPKIIQSGFVYVLYESSSDMILELKPKFLKIYFLGEN